MTMRHIGLWAGVVGPILFVLTFTLEGACRSGYNPVTMYVSALSLGPRGWIQAANFLFCGVLVAGFGVSAARELRTRKISAATGWIVALIGIGLAASGIFTMDRAATPWSAMSAYGRLHQLMGALVFSLAPISCLVLAWNVRGSGDWRAFRRWSLSAGLILIAAIIVQKLGEIHPFFPTGRNPLGLIQRTHLVTFLAWVTTLAHRLLRANGRANERGTTQSG